MIVPADLIVSVVANEAADQNYQGLKLALRLRLGLSSLWTEPCVFWLEAGPRQLCADIFCEDSLTSLEISG